MPTADSLLELALAEAPAWFQVGASFPNRARGLAAVTLNAAVASFVVELEVAELDGAVRAREHVPGTVFPVRCFERHIEADGWFCLGLPEQAAVSDRPSAAGWWNRLEDYLRMQRTAARTGLWPEQHALSHGAAGLHHQRALDHAGRAGLADAYEAFMLGDPSLLASLEPLLRRTGDRLRNGRCPCPCGRRRRDGHAVLRRNCPHREDVVGVLREERLRKEKLVQFVAAAKLSGMTCCGTMQACPLR